MAKQRGAERPTRSEKRAIGDRSQNLARELMKLGDVELDRVPLEDHVRDAVAESRRVTSNIARRREERRLAGVLRDEDLDEIDAALAAERDATAGETQRFKKAERWRESLIGDDGALERFVAAAAVERSELARLVADARREQSVGKPRGAGRALFRFVRAALDD